jgi:hypothetical protein
MDKLIDQCKTEIIGFYRLMIVGHYYSQLQNYEYPGKIELNNKLYYYNRRKQNKKIVLFLNGGTQFNKTPSIEKIISSLLEGTVNYDIACYINPDTYNLLCVKDICNTIQYLGYKEIDIVGLSTGTLIASHVVSRLINKGTTIQLKLICIDPIMNMYESARRVFDNYYIYRPDRLHRPKRKMRQTHNFLYSDVKAPLFASL